MLNYVHALRSFIHTQTASLLMSRLQENEIMLWLIVETKMKRSIHLGRKFQ